MGAGRYCADGRGVRNVYAEDNRLDTIGSLPKTIAVVDIDRNLFAGPISRWWSHLCTTLYISCVSLHRKYAGARDNDFTAAG
jgi:hypothetical protein